MKRSYKKYQTGGTDPSLKTPNPSSVPNLDLGGLNDIISFLDGMKGAGYEPTGSHDNSVDFSRSTGQYDFSKPFKIFNLAAQTLTGIADSFNNIKGAKKEYEQYLKAVQPHAYTATTDEGLNNLPVYTKYGGMNFKSQEAYKKWLAYGHIHKDFEHTPGNQKVSINGQHHEVKHKMPYGGGPLTAEGAKEILRDGTIHGKKLTPKQRRYFGYVAGGGKPKAQFGVDENDRNDNFNVEAEEGEVFQDDNGIDKVPENSGTHEEGGVLLKNVDRVLEDTSDKRNDIISNALKINPQTAKLITGVDTGKAVSHSKAFELAKDHYSKRLSKLESALSKNTDSLDKVPTNKFAQNSMDLNLQHLNNIPTDGDLFDNLFNHQEMVKSALNIGYKKAMAGGKYKAQYGADTQGYNRKPRTAKPGQWVFNEGDGLWYKNPDFVDNNDKGELSIELGNPVYYKKTYNPDYLQTYPGGRTDLGKTTPTGKFNGFSFEGGLDAYKKAWSPFVDLNNYNTASDAQSATYDYLLGTDSGKDVLRQMWKDYGNTALGLKSKVLTDIAPNGDFSNLNLTDEQLSKLKQAYVDNNLGARTLVPGQESVTTNNDVVNTTGNPDVTRTTYRNFSLKGNPQGRFYEPLHWFDVAAPVDALLSSINRIPAKYNPVEFNQVRLKQQNPLPQLQRAQTDFNAVSGALPNTGVGMSNRANLFSQKYATDNQVLGQYENINNQIKNQEILYNANVRDRQSQADQQAREIFERKVLGSKEAQRQQRLTAMDDLYTRLVLNRKLNREGNLLMKLFPAFDQYGEYNGYKYNFRNPISVPSTGLNPGITPVQTQKKTTENRFITLSNGKKIYF